MKWKKITKEHSPLGGVVYAKRPGHIVDPNEKYPEEKEYLSKFGETSTGPEETIIIRRKIQDTIEERV